MSFGTNNDVSGQTFSAGNSIQDPNAGAFSLPDTLRTMNDFRKNPIGKTIDYFSPPQNNGQSEADKIMGRYSNMGEVDMPQKKGGNADMLMNIMKMFI